MSLQIKNSGNAKLALIMVAALFLIWLTQPTISEWMGKDLSAAALSKKEVNLKSSESTQPATPTVPALMPGTDPFKAHIEKNGSMPTLTSTQAPNMQNNGARVNNSSSINEANQAGADPFKAFLEKQKQQSKDSGISPFEK